MKKKDKGWEAGGRAKFSGRRPELLRLAPLGLLLNLRSSASGSRPQERHGWITGWQATPATAGRQWHVTATAPLTLPSPARGEGNLTACVQSTHPTLAVLESAFICVIGG
jgi:hypothetical protein